MLGIYKGECMDLSGQDRVIRGQAIELFPYPLIEMVKIFLFQVCQDWTLSFPADLVSYDTPFQSS